MQIPQLGLTWFAVRSGRGWNLRCDNSRM